MSFGFWVSGQGFHHEADMGFQASFEVQLLGSTRGLDCGEQLVVHSGHSHKDSDRARRQGLNHSSRVKLSRKHYTRAGGERAVENVDDAVDVVEGQAVQRNIVRPPMPRLRQARHLRRH